MFQDLLRAARCGKIPRRWIDLDSHDPWRFDKLGGGSIDRCTLHEVGPDGQRCLRTRQAEFGLPVETHPDHCQEIRRVTHEPGVSCIVGSSGLARGGSIQAESTNAAARASVHDALEQVIHDIRCLRRNNLSHTDVSFLQSATLLVDHMFDG